MRSGIPLWTLRGIGLALGVVLVYALIQIGVAAAGVLLLLFVAVLLASALEPGLGWLRARLPVVGRAGTIIVVYLAFFVTVVGLAFVVVPAAIGQAQQILADLPPFFLPVVTRETPVNIALRSAPSPSSQSGSAGAEGGRGRAQRVHRRALTARAPAVGKIRTAKGPAR